MDTNKEQQYIKEIEVLKSKIDELENRISFISDNSNKLCSEGIYRAIFKSMPVPLTITRLEDGTYFDVNDTFCQMTGFSREETIGSNPFDLKLYNNPADRESIKEILKKDKSFQNIEITYRTRNNELFHTIQSCELFQHNNETLIIGATQDITKRKIMEQELVKSNKFLDITLNSIGDGLIVTDKTGKIINMNPVAEELTGWNLDEARDRELSEVFNIINEHSRENVASPLHKVIESGKVVGLANHTILISKNGKEYYIADSAAPIRITEDGEILGVVMVFSNRTSQKLAEKLIIEERDRAQQYLDIAGVMIVKLDISGNVSLINQRGRELLEYSQDEIIGKNWFDNFLPEDNKEQVYEVFNMIMEGKIEPVEYFENEVITKKGELKIISWHNSTIYDENGVVAGILSSGNDITDQIEVIKALVESENKFKSITENAIDYIFIKNSERKYSFVNSSMQKLLNMPLEQILGKTPQEIFGQEQGDVIQVIDDLAFAGEIVNDTKSLMIGDRELFFNTVQTPLTYENNTVTSIMGIVRDVTLQKEAELALLESQKRLISAQQIAKMGDFTWDVDTGEVTWSDGIYDLLLYNKSEIVDYKKVNREIHHPDDIERVTNWLFECVNSGSNQLVPNEYRLIRKDGKVIYVRTMGVVERKNGKSPKIFASLQDITERKMADIALQESEAKMRSIFHVSPIGIGVLIGRKIVEVNDKFCEITGYSRDEIIKADAQMVYPDNEEFEFVIKEQYNQIREKGTGHLETKFKRKDGRIIDILLNSTPLDPDKPNDALAFTTLDITDQKINEKELIKAKLKAEESDKLKSTFLANISHEIRTPLNGIMGFVDLLMLAKLPPKNMKHLEFIKENGKLLLSLITSILDISRIEAGQVTINNQPFSIKAFLANVKSLGQSLLMQKNKNIEFTVVGPENIPDEVIGDFTKLNQVMNNLVSNAFKFTEQGEISCGITLRDDDFIEFFVKDTGIGIPEDKWEDIFKPFHQVDEDISIKYGGTGLGLAITKKLIELMNGKVWLTSKQGEGSSFYFTIPYIQADYNETVVSKVFYSTDNNKNYKILVAEDKQVNQLVIEELLLQFGYYVDIVSDGIEVLEYFNTKSKPDLVLMDIRMPRLNGLETTKKIREIEKQENMRRTPIIAITAAVFDEERMQGLSAGCDNYIAKPIDTEVLIRTIKKYLH